MVDIVQLWERVYLTFGPFVLPYRELIGLTTLALVALLILRPAARENSLERGSVILDVFAFSVSFVCGAALFISEAYRVTMFS